MAESLGQATVDLIANTGGFEAGMDRAARKMQSVAKEAAYQGNQLEKLVGQIDPVTGALTRLDKQQQQLDAHFKAGRLPIDDYQKFTSILNAQKVATDSAVTGFGKLERQMAANGQTLKQYQNNLRGVPAQFTDIFVSLQGGQAPLTVLLQQGGQLKDMFGGVGAAGKALGGYVLGLVNPFTVAAAAAVALGVAYKQGSDESTAYNKALAATGNFAGTSADSLSTMAQQVAQTTGTVGAASEVLAQLAGSGKIAVGSFDEIAVAALKTEKATGQAASEIVANFVKIADDPLKAILKLNEGMNFLTETTYSQVKAFQEQGDIASATAIANTAYADALNKTADSVQQNLGYVEKAWNVVKGAAKGAWDAMLNIGRDSTLAEAIAEAQKAVDLMAQAKAANNTRGNGIVFIDPVREQEAQKRLTDLLVQQEEKTRKESSARIAAQQKADALDAAQAIDKIHEGLATKDQQRDKARSDYLAIIDKLQAGVQRGTVQASDPRLNAERIASDLDAIDAKYADKKAARQKAYVEDAGTKELDAAKQVYAVLLAQAVTIEGQGTSTGKLGTAAQELIKWEQQIADIKTKGTLTAAQKSLLADEAAITAQKQQNANLEAQNTLREKAAASAQKLLSLQQQLNDELQNVQSGFDQQMAGIGLGDEARKRLQDDLKIREDYQRKLEKLNRDYLTIQNPTAEDTKAYEDQNAAIKAALERRLQIQQNYYAAEDAAQASWQTGALQAINSYLESANNLAAQSRSLVANAMSGLEDALVSAVETGKLSFKSLADSIIADLARIAAKTLIVQPLIAALFGGSSSGGSSLGGIVGSLFGASSNSESSGLVSTIKNLGGTVYKLYSAITGVGSSVASGYASGGVSGAFNGGVNYYGNMLTNLSDTLSGGFSSLSTAIFGASASQIAANAATSAVLTSTLSQSATQLGTQFAANVGYEAVGSQLAAGFASQVAGQTAATGAAAGAAAGAGFYAQLAAMASNPVGWVIAAVTSAYQSGKLYDQGERWNTKEVMNTDLVKYSGGVGQATLAPLALTNNVLEKLVGGKLAAIFSGSVFASTMIKAVSSKLFGGDWVTKDGGISLGVNDGDFSALQYIDQKKKGGLFSSNKKRTKYSDLDPELEAGLGDAYNSKIIQSLSLYSQLGVQLSDTVLDGFNVAASKISTQGKTNEQIQQALDAWFTTLGDSAVAAINTATNAALDGYTFDGLTTFINNLYGVNAGFDQLNLKMLGVSVAGGKMAESLLIAVGGMEEFTANNTKYYDAFFTDTEKANDTLAAVAKQFTAMGYSLPGTREGFRALVESLDTTTESGAAAALTLIKYSDSAAAAYSILEQRAAAAQAASANYYDLFTTDSEKAADKLLGVRAEFKALGVELPATRQAFMEMVYAAQQGSVAGKATAEALLGLATDADAAYRILEAAAMQGANNAFSALQRAIDAQKASINDMLETANQRVSDLTAVSNALGGAIKALRGDSDEAVKTLRAQAVATLNSALATARAGGSLSSILGFDDALEAVSNNTTDLYSSLNDFNRDQAQTAYTLDELNKLNGKQLTNAEQTVKTLQAQLNALDAQLAFAQSQLDAINGVDNSVKSVADAVKGLNSAILSVLGSRPATGAGSASTNTQANNEAAVQTAYRDILGRDADAPGLAAWTAALANGASYAEVFAAIKASAEAQGIQKHAKGTNSWDGGPALMGEFGPELVLPNGGATVYNAQSTARMLNASSTSSPQEVSDARDRARKNDQNWDKLLRYTQYLEQGFINGFPTVAEG